MAGHSRSKNGVAFASLRPAIHVFARTQRKSDVDARDKRGHDGCYVEAGLLPPTRKDASADSKRGLARKASDDGSSLLLS
jgi:hypothetical protein